MQLFFWFAVHRQLIKKSDNNSKLLITVPKQRSAFVCFATLLVNMPIASRMQMFTSTAAGSS